MKTGTLIGRTMSAVMNNLPLLGSRLTVEDVAEAAGDWLDYSLSRRRTSAWRAKVRLALAQLEAQGLIRVVDGWVEHSTPTPEQEDRTLREMAQRQGVRIIDPAHGLLYQSPPRSNKKPVDNTPRT